MKQRILLLLIAIIVPHILHTKSIIKQKEKAVATRKPNKEQQKTLLLAKIKKLQGEMNKESRTKEKTVFKKRIESLRAALNEIKL